MSPRPPMPLGTYGTIWVSDAGAPYKARARYRDRNGVVRTIARFGQTKTAAKNALRAALSEWQAASSDLSPQTSIRDLAAQWLEGVQASHLATNTKQHYAYAVDRYINPQMGAVRIVEADSGLCDKTLKRITKTNGPSAAKSARAVLNGMMSLAVRYKAITVNPVREAEPISPRKKLARSLTAKQEEDLCDKLRSHEKALAWDLPDLVDWMLATGCRIGEALAAREALNYEGDPLLDLERGTWEVNATTIRIKGQGLVVQEWTKSEAGWRVLVVPPFAVEMLRRREQEDRLRPAEVRVMSPEHKIRVEPGLPVAFAAPMARSLRDPSNTQGDLREVLDSLDCDACSRTGYQLNPDGSFVHNEKGHRVRCRLGPWSWVSSHTFRKTVGTRLSRAGWTAEAIADQLGHSQPSMTQNVYMGRRVVNPEAAKILDR